MNQDEYEELVFKMQRLHKELEQSFLEVNKIVPYDRNDYDVYSPKFVFILQDASRQVDGMFKLIYKRLQSNDARAGLPHPKKKPAKFLGYYNFLNIHGMLVKLKLAPTDNALNPIMPFLLKNENIPKWWQAYNVTKHDLPEGETFGKLGHVLYAIGAVAILHDIAQELYNENLTSADILDDSRWRDYETEFKDAYLRTLRKNYRDSIVDHVGLRRSMSHKSSLFYYLFQFRNQRSIKLD